MGCKDNGSPQFKVLLDIKDTLARIEELLKPSEAELFNKIISDIDKGDN